MSTEGVRNVEELTKLLDGDDNDNRRFGENKRKRQQIKAALRDYESDDYLEVQ